jgi:prepilin-type processing-associated H-X9-DG protein
MKARLRFDFIGFILILALAMPLPAQPLADRVPPDAVAYFGWAGSDNTPANFDSTHFKAILDNSRMRELVTDFVPQVLDRIARQDRNMVQPMGLLKSVILSCWTHPTAIYFAGVDTSNPAQPMPKAALLCRAGADAAKIQQQITAAVGPNLPPMLKIAQVQDVLVVAVGYPDAASAVVAANASLKSSEAFGTAIKQVQSDSMVCAYLDLDKGLTLVENVAAGNNAGAGANIARIIDALGLRSLKHAIVTGGFDGADWMSQSFVEVSNPRSGLMGAIDPKPLTPELLKSIPADATYAAAGRLDLARLLTDLRTSAGQVDPQAMRVFDQVMGAIQLAIAKNPMSDILEPLGADWGIYCSPSASGNGLLGLVVVNHLDDPAKAEASLPTAWINLSNWVNVALSRARAPVQITGQMTDIGGSRVYYAGTPIFAPAWTIKDGNLYMGLYPQTAGAGSSAVMRAAGRTIVDNQKFTALQKRLGVTSFIGFSYQDLPTDAANGSMYQKLLVFDRYAGVSDLFGVTLPEPMLPPLSVLQDNVTPAGSFDWVDQAGIHSKSISPFPGAGLLSEPMMLTTAAPATGAMMVSILLPSLNRARETANRVKCAANMRVLAQGILLYANDNQGKYPPDMATLVTYMDNNGMMPRGMTLICPSSGATLPPNIAQMPADQYAAWANDNSSYVYMGGGLTTRTANAERIVIYEKPDDHDNQGINMLFGDGHVDWIPMPQALQMIRRQQQGR